MDDLATRTGHRNDLLGDLVDCHLFWITQIDRVVGVRLHQTQDSVHEVTYEAETSSLITVTEDG